MSLIRAIANTFIALALVACGGGSISIEAPSFHVGRLQSDNEHVAQGRDEYLTSWLVSYAQDQVELYLSTRTVPFSEGTSDRWAMTVRVPVGETTGTKSVQSVGLRLFSNYRNDCCLNRDDPFGASEQYDHVYAAVDGAIAFQSQYEGSFDVSMQEESTLRSGVFVGPRFRLRGCWKIGGERGASGCSLAP